MFALCTINKVSRVSDISDIIILSIGSVQENNRPASDEDLSPQFIAAHFLARKNWACVSLGYTNV
jgi:hypothetical protein